MRELEMLKKNKNPTLRMWGKNKKKSIFSDLHGGPHSMLPSLPTEEYWDTSLGFFLTSFFNHKARCLPLAPLGQLSAQTGQNQKVEEGREHGMRPPM